MFSLSGTIDQHTFVSQGFLLLYENDPRLASEGFPKDVNQYDSNNGISDDQTRLVINMSIL